MKVLDLIGSRKEVFSITEETSVHQAAQYLREKQVRSVGVVDAGGKIVGVISHSDVSDKVAAENKCPAWMKASDIMTRDLVTVSPEMTMEECLRLMEQAERIPRNAFGERHFASGGIRREGQGRFAGSVYFPPQIASLFDARGQTLVSEPRDVHGGQEEKILCEGGRCFYCSISISTKTPPDVVPKLPGESFL